jgi:hypothetical protein
MEGVMPNLKAEKLYAFMRVANEGLTRYQDLLEKQSAEKAAAKVKAEEAVKACIDHERIFGHQKEAVMDKLAASHEACLEFIRDLAAHRSASELSSIGTPVGSEKTASARGATGAQVADFDETDAGRKFRERLLGSR